MHAQLPLNYPLHAVWQLVIDEDFMKVTESVVEALKGSVKKIRVVLNKVFKKTLEMPH